MPIKIPKELPAFDVLSNENIFVMNIKRSNTQDIRPLKIAILNLMPIKIQAENQLLRYLSNTPLQVEITLLQTKSYIGSHTPIEHLEKFYRCIDDVKNQKFDGLIITGAPVEHLDFEEVEYWEELKDIMDWTKSNVFSTIHICWGAQAALYHHYDIPKYILDKKLFGVYKHWNNYVNDNLTRGLNDVFYAPHSRHTEIKREDIEKVDDLDILFGVYKHWNNYVNDNLTRGLNDVFYAPHSRHTEIKREDIEKVDDLDILSESEEAGVFIVANKNRRQIFITGHLEYDRDTLKNEYLRDLNKGLESESEEAGVFIVANKNRRQIFITGHLEYDRDTLKNEYLRDLNKGLEIEVPRHYFNNDDINLNPLVTWRESANVVFGNWLNYCVYQNTPYNIDDIRYLESTSESQKSKIRI